MDTTTVSLRAGLILGLRQKRPRDSLQGRASCLAGVRWGNFWPLYMASESSNTPFLRPYNRLTGSMAQARVANIAEAIESFHERSSCPMNIALPPELEQLVTARVQSGRFSSVSEVI